jgi:hypothetical protein
MIDPSAPAASWFLWILAVSFLVVFALPLLLAPLWWARRFQWRVAAPDDLALYFGRCLGAVAVAVVFATMRAAPRPRDHLAVLEIIIVTAALLTGVHVWGAVRRRQPWTETVEIALYAGVTVGTFVVYRGLRGG